MSTTRDSCIFLLAFAWAAVLAPPAGASEGPGQPKLAIHGFLTQAYAWTDGPQLLGIPEDGTTDYRDLALQFRYQMSDADVLVIQLAHERKAQSPSQAFQEDVQLDWAFYQRKLPSASSIKIGRVPLPAGIYNEIRDVGTLLPLFAPPFSVYQDVSFTSETIDGLVFSKTFDLGSGWSLEGTLYYGGWKAIESFSGLGIAEAEADDAVGVQLWLETPIQNLRLGFGLNRYSISGGVTRLNEEDLWRGLYVSFDGDFERIVVRGEYYRRDIEAAAFGVPLPDAVAAGYYLQVGVRVADKLTLWGQADFQTVDPNLPPAGKFDFWEDYAIGLSYALNDQLLVRGEYHQNEGYWAENRPSNFFAGDPPTATDYGILSMAVSF